MKRIIPPIACMFLLSCSSGSTSSTTTTPTSAATDSSIFTLTFNGKTYHGAQGLTLNSSGAVTAYFPASGVVMSAQTGVAGTTANCVVSSTILNNYMFSMQAWARGRTVALGSDTILAGTTAYSFTDIAAGNANYTVDSNSIINVTQSDAHWVAGTMNLNLTQGSSHYTATGNFKIYH